MPGLVETAHRLIYKFGKQMTLERSANTGTPSRPTFTVSTSPIEAVITSTREWDAVAQVSRQKMVALISPSLTVAPEPNDIIEDADGVRYEIKSVDPLKPANTVLLYQADIGTP